MDAYSYQIESYTPPSGARIEKERRREEWDEYQQQRARRTSMSAVHEKPSRKSPATSRKRADSHQPATTQLQARRSVDASHDRSFAASAHSNSTWSHDDPRRGSSTDYGYDGATLSPQHSSSNPYGEISGLSCNFNAPTHVELERTREHRKSLPSVEKLRSKVKGWVRT